MIARSAGPIEGILDDARAQAQGRSWGLLAAFLAWFAWILVNSLIDPVWYWPYWSYLNLGIHEMGHVVFAPLGETLMRAGGSIFQCLPTFGILDSP